MYKWKVGIIAFCGGFITISKPILFVIDRLAEIDFMNTYLGAMGRFLETGWGTLATVVGGMSLIAWAVYLGLKKRRHVSPVVVRSEITSGNELAETKTTEPTWRNPLDLTILVEWSFSKLPEVFPPSGKIDVVGFRSHVSTGIGTTMASGTPGSKAPEWVVEMQNGVHLCRVTNNGEESLFHVQMEFTVIYHAIIEDKSGNRSGDVLGFHQWPLHILRLVPLSQGGSYDLYMWNAGSEAVEITLPKTAKVQRLREIEWREVQLITPLCSGFYIGPNRASVRYPPA